MSQLKIPIPTIEDIVDANAYEARMHFLNPDGSKFILEGMVSKPTAEVAQAELPLNQTDGFLLWVGFTEPEVIGMAESRKGLRYRVVSHTVGEIAIRTLPDRLQPYGEVLSDEAEPNSLTRLWAGSYGMNVRRNFFGQKYNSLDDIYELYARTGVKQEFATFQAKAKREGWDSRIDLPQAYVVRLARTAMEDFPELFTQEAGWPYKRLHALDKVLEKIASFE